MIVRRFKINMIPGGKMAEVALSQYDSDVTLEFELYASDGTFVVESGTTAVFRGSKPDKNGISVAAELESTIDSETGKNIYLATVDVIPQMTAVAGRSLYELSLQKGGEELNTANFILDIERAPLDADTLPSESVIRELVDVIDKADEIIAAAEAVTTAIDDTLTQQGKAADAKKVGDEISDIKADLSHIGLSDDVKTSLLACFSHVAWVNTHGQDYYDALEAALYADSYPRITAAFDAGVNVIYTDDALDTLKQYLTIKYFATKDSAGTVIASNDYTLSGVLTEGTSTVTVAYDEVRTSVSIPGVINFYNIWEWSSNADNVYTLNSSITTPTKGTLGRIKLDEDFVNLQRRSIVVRKGINSDAQYYYKASWETGTGYYPIPVPKTATGFVITLSEATQSVVGYLFRYPGTGANFDLINNDAVWHAGTHTSEGFDAQENLFLGVCVKRQTSDPETTVTIQFT